MCDINCAGTKKFHFLGAYAVQSSYEQSRNQTVAAPGARKQNKNNVGLPLMRFLYCHLFLALHSELKDDDQKHHVTIFTMPHFGEVDAKSDIWMPVLLTAGRLDGRRAQ